MPETPMQRALRTLTYGTYIVSAESGGEAAEMLSPWVTQVGLEPPTLAVSLPANSKLAALLGPGSPFAVSVLRAGQKTVAERYLGGDPRAGEDHPRAYAENGAPYRSDALAVLECEHAGAVETGGDHTLLLGKITAARMLSEGHPLTLRQTGFDPLDF